MSFGSRSLGKPSAEQESRWALIRDTGCIACRTWGAGFQHPEIHHRTIGDKHGAPRLSHWQTVGLCAWHHRGTAPYPRDDMEQSHGPSFARTPRAFRREFRGFDWLLNAQNALIGWATEAKTLSDGATITSPSTLQQKTRRKGSKRGTHTKTPDKCRIGWIKGEVAPSDADQMDEQP